MICSAPFNAARELTTSNRSWRLQIWSSIGGDIISIRIYLAKNIVDRLLFQYFELILEIVFFLCGYIFLYCSFFFLCVEFNNLIYSPYNSRWVFFSNKRLGIIKLIKNIDRSLSLPLSFLNTSILSIYFFDIKYTSLLLILVRCNFFFRN